MDDDDDDLWWGEESDEVYYSSPPRKARAKPPTAKPAKQTKQKRKRARKGLVRQPRVARDGKIAETLTLLPGADADHLLLSICEARRQTHNELLEQQFAFHKRTKAETGKGLYLSCGEMRTLLSDWRTRRRTFPFAQPLPTAAASELCHDLDAQLHARPDAAQFQKRGARPGNFYLAARHIPGQAGEAAGHRLGGVPAAPAS
jgi:hypothetical protein